MDFACPSLKYFRISVRWNDQSPSVRSHLLPVSRQFEQDLKIIMNQIIITLSFLFSQSSLDLVAF